MLLVAPEPIAFDPPRRHDPMRWKFERSKHFARSAPSGGGLGTRAIVGVVLALVMLAAGAAVATDDPPAQSDRRPNDDAAGTGEKASPADVEDGEKEADKKVPPIQLGLVENDSRAFAGLNLMSPLNSSRTYLFDVMGRVVRTWQSDCSPTLCAYLLDNGHVLRGGSIGLESQVFGPGPGVGGRVQEFNWAGELVWDFRIYNAKQLPHHDLTRL